MRADKFFAERFGSRTKAAEAIERGLVLINGKRIKSKADVKETDEITFIKPNEEFVSNGGYKLSRAISCFSYNPTGKTFVDIGASTGGFTDCLLQNGAKRVYSVDIGDSLLHKSLLEDERVVIMDNINARYLSIDAFDEKIDGVVTDVSFISLRLIFPTIAQILGEDGDAFVLIKPQFECENKNISKNGIVHTSAHPAIIEKVLEYLSENKLYAFEITNAPIRKGKNIEYILHIKRTFQGAKTNMQILETVKAFIKSPAVKEYE